MKKEYNPYDHPVREFIGTVIAVILCLPIFLIIFISERVWK